MSSRLWEKFNHYVFENNIEQVKYLYNQGGISPTTVANGIIIAMKNEEKKEILDFLFAQDIEYRSVSKIEMMKTAIEYNHMNVFIKFYTGKETRNFFNYCLEASIEAGSLAFCKFFLNNAEYIPTKLGEMLMLATKNKCLDIVTVLLKTNKLSNNQISIAYETAAGKYYNEIADLLYSTGKVKSNYKKSSFILCAEKNNIEQIEKTKMKNEPWVEAFIAALENGNVLAAKHVRGEHITKNSIKSSLNKAVFAGKIESVKYLLPEIESFKTAIEIAIEHQRCDILELFYNAGKMTDCLKSIAFEMAIKNEKLNVLRLFTEKLNMSNKMIERGWKLAKESEKLKSSNYLYAVKCYREESARKKAEMVSKIIALSKECMVK